MPAQIAGWRTATRGDGSRRVTHCSPACDLGGMGCSHSAPILKAVMHPRRSSGSAAPVILADRNGKATTAPLDADGAPARKGGRSP
jgi:hypothetical protein